MQMGGGLEDPHIQVVSYVHGAKAAVLIIRSPLNRAGDRIPMIWWAAVSKEVHIGDNLY